MTLVLDEGSVTNIAVHPAYRRLGLGREVTRALLRFAKEKGVTDVFLEVRESNLPAISLYRSEGFIPCGVRKNFYRHPVESAIQMVWREE
jgi:ribosomal-protein-alanine N-acetyltransferase